MASYNPMAAFQLLNGGNMTGPSIDPMAALSAGAVGQPNSAAPAGGGGGFLGGMLGGTDANGIRTDGWGGMALGAAQGLAGGYLGMKQYGLAKEQLAESKRQFDLNYGAQTKMTNSRLEDRQRARVASNPGAYRSVGEYMNKNGV